MKNRKRIAFAAVAVAGTLAVALGAVGLSTSSTPAAADQGKSGRGQTLVTFSDAAVSALGPLSPAAARPGSLGLNSNETALEAAFPIVGNTKSGVISHVGGLTLRNESNILTLRNYKIDTASGVLTATAIANGRGTARIPFLNLTPTGTQPGCDASAQLTLAQPAAAALTLLFGAPDLTGAPIGTACVDLP